MRFHVNQPDIVQRLRRDHTNAMAKEAADVIDELRQRLFHVEEELKLWFDRYQSEKEDHEATMKAWTEERSGH